MKKIFKQLRVSENEKISDKTMTYNIIACVVGVLLCMTSLAAATWAWFSGSVTSSANSVSTGQYSITVSVSDPAATENSILTPNTDGSYTLKAGVKYTVSIKGEGTVSTGYCIARFGDNTTKYYSEQIFTEASKKAPNTIVFEITAAEETNAVFEESWGTYSGDVRDIVSGRAYTVSGNVLEPSSDGGSTVENEAGNENEANVENEPNTENEANTENEPSQGEESGSGE